MEPAATRPEPTHEWLTAREACALIGVSPATLRRWSDAGDVPVFTTPGGHRRFSRSAILGLLPPSHRCTGGVPAPWSTAALSTVYCDQLVPVLGRLRDGEGTYRESSNRVREHGQRISDALAEFVQASSVPRRRGDALRRAVHAAGDYGQAVARMPVRLDRTVEAFLQLRRVFVGSLAEKTLRDGLDVAEATDLLAMAADAFDQLVLALLRGHGAEAAQLSRGK